MQAFTGAHGVFLVTDFYRGAGGKADTEIEQGKNAVDAAHQASVCHSLASALSVAVLLLVPKWHFCSSTVFMVLYTYVATTEDVMHVQAAVNHLVWSSLEDPRPVIKGALPEVAPGRIIPHWESKAEITVRVHLSALMHFCNLTLWRAFSLQPDPAAEHASEAFEHDGRMVRTVLCASHETAPSLTAPVPGDQLLCCTRQCIIPLHQHCNWWI